VWYSGTKRESMPAMASFELGNDDHRGRSLTSNFQTQRTTLKQVPSVQNCTGAQLVCEANDGAAESRRLLHDVRGGLKPGEQEFVESGELAGQQAENGNRARRD